MSSQKWSFSLMGNRLRWSEHTSKGILFKLGRTQKIYWRLSFFLLTTNWMCKQQGRLVRKYTEEFYWLQSHNSLSEFVEHVNERCIGVHNEIQAGFMMHTLHIDWRGKFGRRVERQVQRTYAKKHASSDCMQNKAIIIANCILSIITSHSTNQLGTRIIKHWQYKWRKANNIRCSNK